MATIPAMAHQRRKKPATYGKPSRNGGDWNVTTFDALEEYGKPRKTPAISTFSSRHANAINEKEALPKPKSVKGREDKGQDIWEVSSDDEVPSPIRITSPPKFQIRSKTARVLDTPEAKLAPWEERQEAGQSDIKPGSHTSEQKPHRSNELNLVSSRSATEGNEAEQNTNISKTKKPKILETSRKVISKSPPRSSAAARLHAKRPQGTVSTTAREHDLALPRVDAQAQSDLSDNGLQPRPRKKVRSVLNSSEEDYDIAMTDAPRGLQRQGLQRQGFVYEPSECDTPGADVYDMSEPDTDTQVAQITQAAKRRIVSAHPDRVDATSRRKSWEIRPGKSKMPDDSDTPEATSRSPSMPQSAHVTPPPNAPQSRHLDSLSSTSQAQGAITPKQANLWKRLLPVEAIGPSPSMLAMEHLNLDSSGRHRLPTTSTIPDFTPRPKIFPGRRGPRLVDRLKASAPGSEDEMSEQSEVDSEQSTRNNDGPCDNDEPTAAEQSQSQSQSQPARADGGPKITYARDRSYLREESLEEGLMYSLSEDTPQRPNPTMLGRNTSKQASQRSAFDFDESDEEGASGRMRTVHELRAGGGNQRFMDEIGGLLDDISDHNISARSRRRTALVEITNKLSDRAYAERFLRQGFEQSLIKECGSTPDEIADFATTAALVSLMSSDLPEHAIQSLQDHQYLSFLVRLLSMTSDVRRLARDRRYNMSKSAQLSFIAFVDTLAQQQSLWGDSKPAHISHRLIALKSMEQVVQRLRRLGHRTELVAASDVAQIWPAQDGEMREVTLSLEDTLAISVLESLSTSTPTLAWPSELVERLGELLTALASSGEGARPTHFLALRLCLNLTNGNARSCRVLSARPTVVSLLRATRAGFAELGTMDTTGSPDEQRALRLDILLLSMGILMNLAEHDDRAGEYASEPGETAAILGELVAVCHQGQRRALEAASEEESASNVAYGYLAVTLAQLCRYARAKGVIASRLPGGRLEVLVTAVEEFVEYHKHVDRLSSEGGQGMDIWSAFTEKLEGVLARLKTALT